MLCSPRACRRTATWTEGEPCVYDNFPRHLRRFSLAADLEIGDQSFE
jgi:hypothetical protein